MKFPQLSKSYISQVGVALAFLMIVIFASALVPFTNAQTVSATVNVGVEPYGVAYDSSKGEVFVVDEASYAVSVISDNTNTIVANISVGSDSHRHCLRLWERRNVCI